MRALEVASRAGVPVEDVEGAVARLCAAGVLVMDAPATPPSDAGPVGPMGPGEALIVRVAPEYVTDGPAAAVAWGAVTDVLAGSAAALLVARALADCMDRPGRPAVVPYAALVRATRYSEGMVKRGVASVRDAGVVVQHPSRGRAPAYAFADWTLGRAPAPAGSPLSRVAPSTRGPVNRPATPSGTSPVGLPGHGPAEEPASAAGRGMLRASLAGVAVEVPAVTGAELVVETVVDGRPVTARLTIPAVRG